MSVSVSLCVLCDPLRARVSVCMCVCFPVATRMFMCVIFLLLSHAGTAAAPTAGKRSRETTRGKKRQKTENAPQEGSGLGALGEETEMPNELEDYLQSYDHRK